MDQIQCPHCHSMVSIGAFVCRGCGAEVEYGMPGFFKNLIIFSGIFVIYMSYKLLPNYLSLLSWVIGIVFTIICSRFLKKVFRKRVIFTRRYFNR